MTEFLQNLSNGIVLGAMYGLIAIGYTMVYGIVQLINFAHGEIFMIGGFGSYAMYSWIPFLHHISLWAALPLMLVGGMVASMVVAFLAERIAYRPLRNAPRLAPLITAIGLSLFLQQTVFLFFKQPGQAMGAKGPIAFPQLRSKPIHLGKIVLQPADFITVGLAIVCMAALAVFVQRTRTGRAMQATAQDPDTAKLMGIDTDKIIVIAFVVGAALAAVAGLTQGLRVGRISFDMGFIAGLKAFTAAVLGGIGNVYGAMLGGLVLGIVEVLTTNYVQHVPGMQLLGGGSWNNVWAFVILILVLLVRPQGLLGERVADRA